MSSSNSNMSPPCKETFFSIISEIIDKSKNAIVETEDILEYDAIEITLLLKSIGFRLFSLDFSELANDQTNDIEIEIKCRRSGLHSKMILQNNKKCTCPSRKGANNNSFWEVQGIAPSPSSKGIVQDVSCNLLPDISKKSARIAKAMLAVLLQNYQMSFLETEEIKQKTLDVKQIADRFQLKDANYTKAFRGNSTSPGDRLNTETAKNSHCSTPLSSINVTPTPSYDGSIESTTLPKILIATSNENVSDENNEASKQTSINNLTETRSDNSDKDKTFDKLNAESERDICLIKEIQDARKRLDTALLILKCNVTKDLSSSSVLMVTPQIIKKKPSLASLTKSISSNKSSYLSATSNTSNNSLNNSRRHSTGSNLVVTNDLNNKNQRHDNKTEIKRRSIGTPNSYKPIGSRLLDAPRQNLEMKRFDYNGNNGVKPSIKRSSTGSSLKSVLVRSQLTKSVSKSSPTVRK